MLHVAGGKEPVTFLQYQCMKFLKKDPKSFLAELGSMQRGKRRADKESDSGKEIPDEGAQNALDIYAEWKKCLEGK
jgi:hypothetical protein